MMQAQHYRINAPQVAAEVIGGEAIVVNLDTGAYFSLRDTAADIWQALERGEAVAQLTSTMIQRYAGSPDVIESAVRGLIDELLQERLIAATESLDGVVPASEEENVQTAHARPAFQEPKLEKFTDMADLLLLDPIHEVAEQGWPSATAQSGV